MLLHLEPHNPEDMQFHSRHPEYVVKQPQMAQLYAAARFIEHGPNDVRKQVSCYERQESSRNATISIAGIQAAEGLRRKEADSMASRQRIIDSVEAAERRLGTT